MNSENLIFTFNLYSIFFSYTQPYLHADRNNGGEIGGDAEVNTVEVDTGPVEKYLANQTYLSSIINTSKM